MLKIEKFIINKFNGDQNIEINFEDNRKLLIAENGSGKTTIMNIMYFALKNDVNGLKKYDFESCVLKFERHEEIVFTKNKLDKINQRNELRRLHERSRNKESSALQNFKLMEDIGNFFLKNIGLSNFENLLFDYFSFILILEEEEQSRLMNIRKKRDYLNLHFTRNGIDVDSLEVERFVERLIRINYIDLLSLFYFVRDDRYQFHREYRIQLSHHYDVRIILKSILHHLLVKNVKDNEEDKKILNNLSDKLIFLPTYRRIEHDSIELFSEEISLKEGAILSFGVGDVSTLFNKISDKLNTYATNSFNKINSRALNDFISGAHENDYSISKWYEKEDDYFVKVLQRVGKEIDENNKLKLKLIFSDKYSDDKFLLKLIKKMCEIYDNQSRIENEIIKYITVCNKYLFNKEFFYDKENLKISIFKKQSDGSLKDIKLSSLSSGEKQIISIFAKLYLSHLVDIDLDKKEDSVNQDGYWILFDEPELSLSVDWQEMLLPDIIESKRCSFIFSTTHSPFIFNNNFKYYTSHINECIQELGYE